MMNIFQTDSIMPEADMEGENIQRQFYTFLREFQIIGEDRNPVYFYREEVTKMVRNKRTTLYLDFKHLMDHDGNDLIDAINLEYYR
jgi:hypothetical protein